MSVSKNSKTQPDSLRETVICTPVSPIFGSASWYSACLTYQPCSVVPPILRMADLMTLQPNMNIALHIVAPVERRDQVMQEITRLVFSLLDEHRQRKFARICRMSACANLSRIQTCGIWRSACWKNTRNTPDMGASYLAPRI